MAFPSGWGRKQKITIQSSQVVGSGTHSDFQVLVTLDHLDAEIVDAGSNSALNGGGDIRFSNDSAGASQIACEIVNFVTNASAPGRKCEIWVKVPSISTSANTDFYIWYNKSGESQPAADASYGSEEVWSDYVFLSHDMLNDSTGNNSITIDNAGTVTDSPFGSNAYLFDGSNDYLTSTVTGITVDGNFTMTGWFRHDGGGDAYPRGVAVHDGTDWAAFINDEDGGNGAWTFAAGSGSSDGDDAPQFYDDPWGNSWCYLVGTHTGVETNQNLRVNKNNAPDSWGGWTAPNSSAMRFGARTTSANHFDGAIARFGIRSTVVSVDITDTEYNMMADPASFASTGMPEAAGGDIVLVVADSLHGHGIENVILTQVSILVTNDAAHTHDADNIDFQQLHHLNVDNANHAQAADSCNVGEVISIAITGAGHALISDIYNIVQLHLLETDGTHHVQNSENLLFSVSSDLTIQDATHDHEADNLTIDDGSAMQIQSSVHALFDAAAFTSCL